jgi:hypothetical protein
MIIGGKDRTDYRAMSTSELIDEVKYAIGPQWRELATALAERLEDKQRKLDGYRYDMAAERSEWEG